MAKRRIPNLHISIQDEVDYDIIHQNSIVQATIFKNLILGITEANKTNRKEAILVELNSSGYYIQVARGSWKKSLESAQQYYTKLEEYETCAIVQKLIESINSYGTTRSPRKTSRTNQPVNRD
jgi:hypothetical protein